MEVINVPVRDLIPYEKNAKNHPDDQIEHIANSIREFGFRQPLVIDAQNVVVIGHGRLMAAKKLGMAEVPCVRADDLSEAQIKALRLADNKTNESEWDFDALEHELDELSVDFDMSDFGFDAFQVEEEPQEAQEDDYDVDAPVEPTAKLGDIYKLGQHRLMCGDSTSKDDMDALMDGERPLFVFTDPPYGVSIGDKNLTLNSVQKAGRCTENIKGDTLPEEELYKMLTAAMSNLRSHCDDGCSYYVSAPQGGALGLMMMMMKDAGLEVRHNLIWVKNSATFSLGRLDYDYQHEPIFYTWTKRHTFYGGYATTVVDESKPIDKMSKPELKDLVRALMEKHPQSVVYEDKPMKCDLHPTMKPVKLVARFMVNSSQRGDVVADIFGGSGTTLIAAEQLGRKARLMELDPHYVDVIIARWEKFTGQKAVKIN